MIFTDSFKAAEAATWAALNDPQVGDRFHEMYSWWMFVVAVDGFTVTTLAASAPCTFPDDGQVKVWSRAEFVSGNCYSSMPDTPTIQLVGRGYAVAGWLT